ncbi:MAG: T9SS type A sorting domain-containing protein [candidate division Zixibacteria bacterium]|nr:T9SS type A sorting domain-containing protein [candidate division Zixibacteria bacterium]
MSQILALVMAMITICAMASANTITLNDEQSTFEATTITSSETELVLNIGSLKSIVCDDGISIELPEPLTVGSGNLPSPGKTILPAYSTLLAVPENAELHVIIAGDEFIELTDFELAKASGDDAKWLSDVTSKEGYYPQELVRFEYAGKMRDLNLARLTIYPVQYDYTRKTLKVHHQMTIRTTCSGGDILPPDRVISEAFYPIYSSIISNIDLLDNINIKRGAYWFIVQDGLMGAVEPLVEWKRLKGFDTRVIPISNISSNPSSGVIRNFISSEYSDADLKPDYICLVGDEDMPGSPDVVTFSYYNPFGMGPFSSDNYYTFLEGNDYFPELFIGRISVDAVGELNAYIDKFDDYERNPYMLSTDWYHNATMVAGGISSWFSSQRLISLWVREMLLNHDYFRVDTLFETYHHSVPLSQITSSISAGAMYVNYRGYGSADGWAPPYYSVGNIYSLSNAHKYGVMTSIVCGTGAFGSSWSDPCFGEAWIRASMKGGAGFIGTTNRDTHTRFNNSIDCGIYWGLFIEGTYTIAQAQLMGKMCCYYAFPADDYTNGRVQSYFNSYHVLGDPELNCWTDIPKPMQITHIDTIDIAANGIAVSVADGSSVPMPNAYVCLSKGQEVFQGGFTDANGEINFEVYPSTAGDLNITVTKSGYIPYERAIIVQSAAVSVGLCGYTIDDDDTGNSSGDGDMIANPHETIELSVLLKNFGDDEAAADVEGTLSSDDDYISITSSTSDFGAISPGDSAESITPFVVEISPLAPHDHTAELLLNVTATGGHNWQHYVHLPITASRLVENSIAIQNDTDGDGLIERGESGEMIVGLFNAGSKDILSAQGILRTYDPLVNITDSTCNFGDIEVNGTGSNSGTPFSMSLAYGSYNGHQIEFILKVTGASGHIQTVEFTHMIGAIASSDPFGPDEYGYYCFDNTDTDYPLHPEYEWIPIDGSWQSVYIQDDNIVVRDLPFVVQYYGESFNEFSIVDNGYIAMGSRWYNYFKNTNIPSPQCAPAMIAPLWDDFQGSNVRYHHDDVNGKFIVAWNNVMSRDTTSSNPYQHFTFELIILDTAHWPTATGDNDIIFQYQQCIYPDVASVGICNEIRDIGLQYVFNNAYTGGAATLAAGRAIKFTTCSDYTSVDDDNKDNLPAKFYLAQNYPNPFNPTTNISYELPSDGIVNLEIFDILGRKVRTLVDEYQSAGRQTIIWNSRDSDNNPVSAGIYFYRLQAGDSQIVKKMVLLK